MNEAIKVAMDHAEGGNSLEDLLFVLENMDWVSDEDKTDAVVAYLEHVVPQNELKELE